MKKLFLLLLILFTSAFEPFPSREYSYSVFAAEEAAANASVIDVSETETETETSASTLATKPLSPYWVIPLVPGSILVPGLAHHIRGEATIARRFFRSGLGSILMSLAGGIVLGVTGAADAVILPTVPLVLLGLTSWFSLSFADVVGSTLSKPKKHDYSHNFNLDLEVFYRFRRIDDYFFNTNSYHQVGGAYWFGNKQVQLSVERSLNGKIVRYDGDFGLKLTSYYGSHTREGLYAHIAYAHEDNLVGYYSVDTIQYKAKSTLNLAAIGSHLSRIDVSHEVGIQQHFVTYHTPNFDGIESSTGLIGGFDLSWTVSDWLKPAIGYMHERDSSISTLTSGFVGVYYVDLKTFLADRYLLSARGYLGNSKVFELAIESSI